MKKIIYLLLVMTTPIFGQDELLNFKGTNAKNYYEEITFEYIGDKIIVPVKIEGKTYRFLFDTGAPCMISKEIFESIQPKILKQTEMQDVNQISKKIEFVSLEKLKFGGVVFENLPVGVNDFNSSIGFNCFNFDGIIGPNLFVNSIFQIDLPQKKIRFTDNIEKLHLNKKQSKDILHLVGFQKSPHIELELLSEKKQKNKEGQLKDIIIKEDLLFDTGASRFYSISKEISDQLIKNNMCDVIGESKGFNGISAFGSSSAQNHFKFYFKALMINNFSFIAENIIATTNNDKISSIGSSILEYGIVTFDYRNKKFYISPFSKVINVAKSEFGIEPTYREHQLIVDLVWDDELKKKISYGDEIIEINGKAPTICDLILNNPFKNQNKMKLKIKTKKGEIVDLNLEKKFPKMILSREERGE